MLKAVSFQGTIIPITHYILSSWDASDKWFPYWVPLNSVSTEMADESLQRMRRVLSSWGWWFLAHFIQCRFSLSWKLWFKKYPADKKIGKLVVSAYQNSTITSKVLIHSKIKIVKGLGDLIFYFKICLHMTPVSLMRGRVVSL